MASATGGPSQPSSYSAEVSLLLGQSPPVQPSSGLVTNTIIFWWLITIKDQNSSELFLAKSWALYALGVTPGGVCVSQYKYSCKAQGEVGDGP